MILTLIWKEYGVARYLCFGPNLQTRLWVGITAFSPKEVEHKVEPKTLLCNQNLDSKPILRGSVNAEDPMFYLQEENLFKMHLNSRRTETLVRPPNSEA